MGSLAQLPQAALSTRMQLINKEQELSRRAVMLTLRLACVHFIFVETCIMSLVVTNRKRRVSLRRMTRQEERSPQNSDKRHVQEQV